jgi:hypothetical protein
MALPPRARTVADMHASSMSEAGAFRIVLAVLVAAAIALVVGATLSVAAGVAIAIVAVVAGLVFEIRHMAF